MDILIYILTGVFSVVLLFAIAATLISYLMAFYTARKHHFDIFFDLEGELDEGRRYCRELIESFIKIPYEDVYTESFDGLKLHARYYHTNDGAPLQIQFHGYRSVSVRDFSGIGAEALKMGHNVLLIDERAHGLSEGSVISFGINERFDVKTWAEYAVSRFGGQTKIILAGISMGAATVLMASELELPKNVIGILADCPYSSPSDIIKKVTSKDVHLPAALLYPFTKLAARLCGFNLEASSAKEAVMNTEIPILLIHGTKDNFVPIEMSDKIAEAGKTVTYKKITDAAHGLSFIKDYDSYMAAYNEFLLRICKDETKHENQ